MEQDQEDFYGSAPIVKRPTGGNAVPISPGFGMTGPQHPGGTSMQGPAGPGRSFGDRSRSLIPPTGLLANGDGTKYYERDQPSPYISDVSENRNWFSPFQPVWPFGPPFVTNPREWDYPVGTNLEYQPRRFQAYEMLRTISKSWGVLAEVIEARIDELVALPWQFQLKEDAKGKRGDASKDKRIQQLNAFFKKPDGKRPFPIWMRMIYRDRYIIDAASCFIARNRGGTPYAIEALDGATIKPLIDDAGRIPDYPQPAYQQIIKGLPMNNFTEREIIYMPARPRTELPIYGYSEVEQVIMEATEGIRKTLYQLNFWTEGTIPDMMLGVPEAWTPEQIAIWQASFDSLLSGNLQLKSRVRFVPGGMKPFEMKGSAGELLKTDYDEWITRIICFAFRVAPKPFIREPASRAAAESEHDALIEQGLQTEMVWWKCFMDEILNLGWGFDDIEFNFKINEETDPLDQSTILTNYVKTGVMTVDESREQLGLDPIPGGDVGLIYIATGAVLLEDMANGQLAEQAQQSAQMQADAKAQAGQQQPGGKKPGTQNQQSKGGATAKRLDPFTRSRQMPY